MDRSRMGVDLFNDKRVGKSDSKKCTGNCPDYRDRGRGNVFNEEAKKAKQSEGDSCFYGKRADEWLIR